MNTPKWLVICCLAYAVFIGLLYTWLLVQHQDPAGLVVLMISTIPGALSGIYTSIKTKETGHIISNGNGNGIAKPADDTVNKNGGTQNESR